MKGQKNKITIDNLLSVRFIKSILYKYIKISIRIVSYHRSSSLTINIYLNRNNDLWVTWRVKPDWRWKWEKIVIAVCRQLKLIHTWIEFKIIENCQQSLKIFLFLYDCGYILNTYIRVARVQQFYVVHETFSFLRTLFVGSIFLN